MRCLSERDLLFVAVLGCSVLFTLVHAGKEVRFKIHVPEFINHKHHTNIVYVHKYSDDKDKDLYGYHKDKTPKYKNPFGYSYNDHYTFGDPNSNKYTHSYDHHQHYSYRQDYEGDGNGHKKQNLNQPKQQTLKIPNKINNQKHVNSNKYIKPKEKFSAPIKTNPFSNSFIPSINPFKENNVRETNHSFVHARVEVQTNDGIPEVKHFNDFSFTVKDGYEVEEPSAELEEENKDDRSFGFEEEHKDDRHLDFQEEHQDNRDPKYINPYLHHFVNSEEVKEDKKKVNSDDYAEDYTDPNSVAKYTSAIRHGAIGLEDSNYNPKHSNDLEDYIRGYITADEIH